MSYTVYHSALIYLIDPNRKLIDVFDYQIGAEGLTAALDKVLGKGKDGAKAAPAAESKSAVFLEENAVFHSTSRGFYEIFRP